MSDIKQLRAELGRVNELLQTARETEKAEVLARFKEEVELFGITESEIRVALGFDKAKKTKAEAKYYDPFSGKSWSGRGRVPGWLAGKKIEDYRIERAPNAKPWWPEKS